MKLKRIHLAEQVRERLLAAIGGGEFIPGARVPSIRRLSAELGVSPVTVQKAVRELTEEGILEVRRGAGIYAAGKLPEKLLRGCRARSRPRGKTLYFFFPTLQSSGSYHASILCTIRQEAEKREWNLRVQLLSPEQYESAAGDPDAAGIVCTTPPYPLPPARVPVIHYGMSGCGEIPAVTPDNYAAGFAAGLHLKNRGIETIRFVTSAPRERRLAERHFLERFSGLRDAFRTPRCGLEIPLLHWAVDNPCRKEVEAIAAAWINGEKEKEYPVLVVGNRSMALEIGLYLAAVGLRVPEDIGLLSFIRRNSAELQIPIDTFDFDHRQMGEQIMLLLDQAQAGRKLPTRVFIPMTLTEEGSIRSLRTVPD